TRIVRVDPASGELADIALVAATASQMMATGADLVLSIASAKGGNQLVRVPKTGGAPTPLRPAAVWWPFAIDGTALYYFATRADAPVPDFVRAPFADSSAPASPVIRFGVTDGDIGGVGSFATDASAVYFVGSEIMRGPASGILGAKTRLMKVAK